MNLRRSPELFKFKTISVILFCQKKIIIIIINTIDKRFLIKESLIKDF